MKIGVFTLILAGCAATGPTPTPTPRLGQPTPLATLVPTATLTPTPTWTPTTTPTLTPTPAPKRAPKATPLKLPGPEKPLKPEVGQVSDPSSAASWRKYAEECLKVKAYAEASQAFAKEAAIYRKKGDPQAALVEDLKAARYRTEIELYGWLPSQDPVRPLARLEPMQGCYVGAFIDRDDLLQQHMFGPQRHGDIEQFNQRTGKKHASFFTYLGLQREFPKPWADYVREQGAFPQLAWEPQSLDQVSDQLLERFVRALQEYDGPVMVRFAGEMNGEWTRYHGDPAAYRKAFRRVYQALRQAPKAALMWCPNAVPVDNIASYYPGDDACDWVGVNFYSVLFLDNNPKRPGDWIHPIDLLNSVYRDYSRRKPVAIGEYAASHEASSHPTPRIDFARIKMAQLYQSLPLKYPGVKLVSWYDCNNLTQARSERQLNNFQLTDVPEIVDDYRRWVNGGWFLAAGETSTALQARPFPKEIPGPLEVEPWVRSYDPNPTVFLRLDGKLVAMHQLPEGGRFALPTPIKAGKHKLELLVYDRTGQYVGARTFDFVIPE